MGRHGVGIQGEPDRAVPPAAGPPEATAASRTQRVKGSLAAHWRDPLYRNSYYLMANTLVITGSGFVFWLLAARLAPPEQIGLATAVVSAMTLVSLIARLGFDVSLMRHLPTMQGAAAHKLINSTFTISGFAAVLGAVIFAAGTGWWSPALSLLKENHAYAAGFAALTLVWTLGTLMDTLFVARRRGDYVLWKNVLHSVLKVAILVALVGLLGAPGIVLSWGITMAVAVAVAGLLWLPKTEKGFGVRPGVDLPTIKAILAGSFANYAASLILVLPQSLGSLIVLHRFGTAAAGYFYVLWMFGSVALVAPQAFGQTYLVEMASGRMQKLRVGRGLLISAATGLGLLVAATVLLPLFGPWYRDHGFAAVVPFGLAAVPGFFNSTMMASLRSAGHHARLVFATLGLMGAFLVPLWLVRSTEVVGWLWLASLTVGATLAWSLAKGSGRAEGS